MRMPSGSRPAAPPRHGCKVDDWDTDARPPKRMKCVEKVSEASASGPEAPVSDIGRTIVALDNCFQTWAVKCLQHVEDDAWSPEVECASPVEDLPDWNQLPTAGGFRKDRVGTRAGQRAVTPYDTVAQTQCYTRLCSDFVLSFSDRVFLVVGGEVGD